MDCNCEYVLTNVNGFEAHYYNCNLIWKKEHPGKKLPKNKDGGLQLPNDNLLRLKIDVMYHLGYDTVNYDLPAMFQDVKFVCMGGQKQRMKKFAKYISEVLGLEENDGKNLTKLPQRYAMYKAGPVLSVCHGVGIPSMITVLQEIIKLLYYAKCKDPFIFRLGTCGGLKMPPGSVVISEWGVNGYLEKFYDFPILGIKRQIPAILDARVCQEVFSMASVSDNFSTYSGGTMGTDDFYRGQGRLDAMVCDYTESEKMEFLNKLVDMGVRNIEMEAPAFAAFTSEVGIRSGLVCVTYLDRFEGDQVASTRDTLIAWQKRPMIIVGRYIASYFNKTV